MLSWQAGGYEFVDEAAADCEAQATVLFSQGGGWVSGDF